MSVSSPNIVLNLSIPHSQQSLAEVLDVVVSQFLVGKLTKEEAMPQIEQGWEQITNTAGHEVQRLTYRSSLGLIS